MKYFYDDADYVGMASHFAGYDWCNQVYDMSVDDMWGHIHGVIVAAVDKFAPHKSFNTANFRRRKAVWMNDKVFAKVRKKRDAFQRYLLTRDGNESLCMCIGPRCNSVCCDIVSSDGYCTCLCYRDRSMYFSWCC